MSDSYQSRMNILINEVTVYPVSCEQLCKGRSDRDWIDAVLAGGARMVQLRDKVSEDRVLYEKALYFREKARQAGALFIVNNRLDIALLADADGVHLGNSDIPAAEARRLAPHFIIGVSANTEEQAASAAARGASYFNIGPLFPTATKKKLTDFLGAGAIPRFSELSPLPFTVMGGIKIGHIPELVEKGARRLAVVTAISEADDMAGETEKWIREIKNQLRKR